MVRLETALVGAAGGLGVVLPRRSAAVGLVLGEERFRGWRRRCGVLWLGGSRRRGGGAWVYYATDAENLPPVVRSAGHCTGRTFYEILGVSQLAAPDQIKAAYRSKALHVHPDVVPEDQKDDATKEFLELKMAYRVLSDRQQRAAYDLKLRFLHRTPIATPTPSQWGFIAVPSSSDDPSGNVTFRGRKNYESDMFS